MNYDELAMVCEYRIIRLQGNLQEGVYLSSFGLGGFRYPGNQLVEISIDGCKIAIIVQYHKIMVNG